MRLCTTVLAALLVAASTPAFAGSIALNDFGARASGRGTAMTAVPDPSSIFFNPANITLLDNVQFDAGLTALMPAWRWQSLSNPALTSRTKTSIRPPPYVSLTYNLGKLGELGDFAGGFGFYAPYGTAFTWPKNWSGREVIQDVSLEVFELNPVIAWRPHKLVSLAGGFRYLPARAFFKRAVAFGTEAVGEVEVAGSGDAFGANAGITVLPIDGLVLGADWRSAATLKVKGLSDFDFPPPFETLAIDGTGSTKIPLAQVLRFGAAYDVLRDLNLAVDLEWQMWNRFKNLRFVFVNPDGSTFESVSPRDSRNTLIVHAGGEYKVGKKGAVRAGYIFDPHTQPENTVGPLPPDSDRHLATIGGSYNFGNFFGDTFADVTLSLHLQYLWFVPRSSFTADFPGKWTGGWPIDGTAYIFGFGVSGRLPTGEKAAFAPAREPVANRSDVVSHFTSSMVAE